MVCGRCGEPLGAKVIPLRRSRRRPAWTLSGRGPGLWWLALMALLGLSGLLAALQIGEEQRRTLPREQRSLELRQRFS
jgi:hypothetical protein